MKSFDKDILKLFSSLGHFSEDYHTLLDSIKDLRDQSVFINDLYRRITSDQYKRDLANEGFGIKVVNEKTLYRYSDKDLELAKTSAPMATEAILEGEGVSLEERIKYRATGKFHERKHEEIKFYMPFVEKDFIAISDRKIAHPKPDDYIDDSSIYSDLEFSFLELPDFFKIDDLDQFFKENNFLDCFFTKDHFDMFKNNTFKLYDGQDTPKIYRLPLKTSRQAIARKIQLLYLIFKEHKLEYPTLNLNRRAFAESLFWNFSEFRSSKSTNPSYKTQISVILGEMR